VTAAAVGRGYVGRHRLEAAALGIALPALDDTFPAHELPAPHPAAALLAETPEPARTPAPTHLPVPALAATPRPALAPARWATPTGARLTVVPVAPSPDPLVDTVPHPVVRLFPMPVAEPVVAVRTAADAVFAQVDAERERRVTAELAEGARRNNGAYHARHTA
jgi:hypothetical protein